MLVHPFSVGTMATIGVLLWSLAAEAADQMVLGSQFLVKDPGTPDKRRVTAKAKEYGTDNLLIGDPVATGATLRVAATGTTSTNQTFNLPATASLATGKPFWTGDALKGFKYKDSRGENGAVRSMQIKRRGTVFLMKVAISGKIGPLVIVPPNTGIAGCVFFRITNADSYSVSFATGNGTVTNGGATYFKVSKPQTEGSCLSTTMTVPTTSSSTSSSTSTSSTSTSSTSTTLATPCGDTTYPTCGGSCPDGFACEAIWYRENLDQLPGCGGVGCTNQATTSCECVAVGSVCGGSCSSDICSFDVVFDRGECGAGQHCAMDVDYYCADAGLHCPVGCTDD